MSELNYAEITELVNALDIDFEPLREKARGRYELYHARRDPYVPDEIAREGKYRITSGQVMHAADTVRADLMMNPTEFTVVPLTTNRDGTPNRIIERKAENLERASAVIWGRLNEGRRIDRDVIWHQLVSPFGVMVLEFPEFEMPDQPDWMKDKDYLDFVDRAEADWMPWHVYLPDPLTCSFVERDGKPVIFARRYKMLVRDVEQFYSKRAGSLEPQRNLRLDGRAFRWASDDYQRDSSHYRGGFAEVDMMWLDDGKYIYQVVEGLDRNHGMVVWCAPNPIGRCSAFIIPGNLTPSREPHDRYLPGMLPLMQTINQVNDIRSTRATAARNLAGPHTYVPIDPEVQKLYMTRGEKLPTDIRWRKNETKYLLGKVEVIPSELSDDWDKLEQGVLADLERVLPSPFAHIVDPAVLKEATATSILHAAETGMRLYGPMITAYDAAIRDLMQAVHDSVSTHYTDIDKQFYAYGDEVAHGKSVTQGSAYSFGPAATDFPYKLLVKTRSMSQAQAAAQYDLVLRQWTLPDGSRGVATLEDLMTAANYSDPTAQRMKLAEEAIINAVDPYLQQVAIRAIQQRILLDSGIDVSLIGAGPQASDQPASIPGGAQRMDSPQVAGPQGGTDGGVMGAGPGGIV